MMMIQTRVGVGYHIIQEIDGFRNDDDDDDDNDDDSDMGGSPTHVQIIIIVVPLGDHIRAVLRQITSAQHPLLVSCNQIYANMQLAHYLYTTVYSTMFCLYQTDYLTKLSHQPN